MERKFFFFDIDGTLTAGDPYGDVYLPDSTKLALDELRKNGHFLAIATGRSYAMAHELMEMYGFTNMVSDGGNGLTIDSQLLGIEPLDHDKCIALIEECKKKDMIWAFSPDDKKRRIAPDNRFYDFTHDIYMETEVVENVNPADYPDIYKVYVACLEPEEQKLEMLNELPWCRFHREYLFVEPADKSRGIKKMVDHFNGDYKDVVVFGDNKNDMSMFRSEWTSIAMGNAIDDLKAMASYVTDDNDEDGIYNACKHFGWI